MTLLQLLGLKCRHRYRSYPVSGRRVCNECGTEFPVDYTVESWERVVDHHQPKVTTITKIYDQVLKFRKRG